MNMNVGYNRQKRAPFEREALSPEFATLTTHGGESFSPTPRGIVRGTIDAGRPLRPQSTGERVILEDQEEVKVIYPFFALTETPRIGGAFVVVG
jgi:hypothetical protein